MSIGSKISWLLVGTAVVVTGLLTWIGYSMARDQYYAGVDRQLIAMAVALPRVLSTAYVDRAVSGKEMASEEYDRMVYLLDDLADRAGVYYVYAFVLDGKRVVHIATSASLQERASKDWEFRREYEEPPQALMETFADGESRFAEYADEYGSFRSVFARHHASDGTPYVVGVDVELSRIHADLGSLVRQYLATGGVVAVLAGVLGTILARRMSRPLQEVAREIELWAQRDFAGDDAIQNHLSQLGKEQRDEAGDLATRFVQMQNRLQAYLGELVQTTAAKQKIENQIKIAQSIQEGLLPKQLPRIENFEITGWSLPADETGGDFFDVLELPSGSLVLTIGDVTGHGLGPALLASASRAYARATINPDDPLDALIGKLNSLLHTDLHGERFVTLVACLLNPKSRLMKLVAAGHGPVMFYSRRLNALNASMDSHGLPLGIADEIPYDQPMELKFEPGDALILVSDGCFEWSDAAGDSFGIQRLIESVLASCREAPDQIIERLRRDLAAFHGGTSQGDDTTALVVRCIS